MKNYEIGVYYWSNWHSAKENDEKRGKGWTEWEYLKDAIPRFAGHQQPKLPIWGYLDDSKTETLELQIGTAADNGIDSFIFDWSTGGDAAELNAFLNASNTDRLKFGLMFCGSVLNDPEEYFTFIIENYFKKPNYWMVDGGPYFSVYEFHKYIEAYGSLEKVAEVFRRFRKMVADAGLGKLHLVAVEWGLQAKAWEGLGDPVAAIEKVGIDAITSYVWAHNTVPEWPCGPYSQWAQSAYPCMEKIAKTYPVPYYYHVSAGWDPTPRCPQNMHYTEGGPLMYHTLSGKYEIFHTPYFSSIVCDNSPEELKKALLWARKKMDQTGCRILTIYAWNEWTEGGYLEPDSQYGYGRLEAIREVFGDEPQTLR